MGHLEALRARLVPEEGFLIDSATKSVNRICITSEFLPLVLEISLDQLIPDLKIIYSLSREHLWFIYQQFYSFS
jgi:hypothetical protein